VKKRSQRKTGQTAEEQAGRQPDRPTFRVVGPDGVGFGLGGSEELHWTEGAIGTPGRGFPKGSSRRRSSNRFPRRRCEVAEGGAAREGGQGEREWAGGHRFTALFKHVTRRATSSAVKTSRDSESFHDITS
jgi:hypothetical protein